jgi:hypothetical protein
VSSLGLEAAGAKTPLIVITDPCDHVVELADQNRRNTQGQSIDFMFLDQNAAQASAPADHQGQYPQYLSLGRETSRIAGPQRPDLT